MREPRAPQLVVAYDLSPGAEDALARAIEVAARAPEHVLHVVTVVAAVDGVHRTSYRVADALHATLRDRIGAAFAGRPTEREVQFYVHVRIGPPAEEILAVAREVGADLLFVGAHHRTTVGRWLLGSVSERVVREAGCPVMVVRPRSYEDVERVRVARDDHARPAYAPPHRYAYVETRVISRPPDWPLC